MTNVLIPMGARPGEFPGAADYTPRPDVHSDVLPEDIGVWLYDYKKGLSAVERPESPLGYAIEALKRELIYYGSERNIVLDTYKLGSNFGTAIRDLQTEKGLTVDGECGYRTAKQLFKARVTEAAKNEGFPSGDPGPRLLHGLLDLESNMDPAATGPSPDEGIAQIVRRFHGVTEPQAYDPAFAIAWAAARIRAYRDQIGSWQAGMVAYNVGVVRATAWEEAGRPATGGVVITVGTRSDGSPITYPLFEWCTLYFNVAKSRAVNYG